MSVIFSEDDVALRLNGTTAYVDLGNPAHLNLTGLITLQAWIKPTATDGLRNILAHGYTASPAAEVYLRIANGQYQVGSWNGADHLAAAPVLAEDQGWWIHLTGVYDGSAWLLYKNGRQVARTPDSTGAVAVPAGWAIGAHPGGDGRFYTGQVRNAAIWRTVRTPEQITGDMRDPGRDADPALAGFWPLDDGSGAVARDFSLNAANGTYRNSAWTRPFALVFNGTNAYVDLANSPTMNQPGPITIQAWINPTATDGLRNIVAHGYSTSPPGEVYLRINNGQYQVGSWNGTDHVAGAPIPSGDIGGWVHLCGVYDGSAWLLYRNGQQIARVPDGIGAVNVNVPWALGARGGGTERFFQGQMRHVAVWRRALDAATIRSNYGLRVLPNVFPGDPTLVGYWPCTEGTGSQAGDKSSQPVATTIHNAAWAEINDALPEVGAAPSGPEQYVAFTEYALQLDGTSAYVDLGNPAALNVQGPLTLQAWVKPTATDGIRNILAHGFTLTPPAEIFLRINNGQYQVGSWNGTDHFVSAPIPPADVDSWVHLCGIYDGGGWTLYRNGQALGRAADNTGAVAVVAPWAIGARPSGATDAGLAQTILQTQTSLANARAQVAQLPPGPQQAAAQIAVTQAQGVLTALQAQAAASGPAQRFFAGQVRHVAIWNRALDPATVQAHATTSELPATEAGRVGYWPLAEGQGAVAADQTAPANNGTIYGATWAEVLTASGTPYLITQARLMQDYRHDANQGGQAVEISGYRTVISARTAIGSPLPCDMTLWGTARAIAHFPDGTSAVLDPARPVTRRTNPQGELSFVVEAGGQLICPPVKVRAAFMGAQERLLIAPDRQAHQILGTLTGTQLRGQAPPPGQQTLRPAILPATVTAAQADAAAEAMRRIMSTVINHDVQPDPSQIASRDLATAVLPAPRPYYPPTMSSRDLDALSDPQRDDIVTHMMPMDMPVVRTLTPGDAFATPMLLDLQAGTFLPMTESESRGINWDPLGAGDWLKHNIADPIQEHVINPVKEQVVDPIQQTFTNPPSIPNIPGLPPIPGLGAPPTIAEIADVFDRARDVIQSGGQVILDTITTAAQQAVAFGEQVLTQVRVTISKVIDGVQRGFQMVLRTVEEGVQFVGTLFESLGAKIQDVINYIKALFNWDDILATAQVIESALREVQRVAKEAIVTLASGELVDLAVTRLKTLINTNFDQWIATLTGQAPPSAGVALTTPPQDVQSKYLQSLFNDNVSNPNSGFSAFQLGQSVIAVAQQLATRLQTAAGNLLSAEEFRNSGLLEVLQHPEQLLTLHGLGVLLQTIKPLVNAALDIASAVIHAVLDLIGVVLNAILDLATTRIYIPVLTEFCERVILKGQSQLTFFSLMSLMAAIPMTVIYKLASGKNESPLRPGDITMLRNLHWSDVWNKALTLAGARDLAEGDSRDAGARPDDDAWNRAGWALSFVGVVVTGVLGTMSVIEDATLEIAKQAGFGILKAVAGGIAFLIGLPLDVVRDGFTNTPSDLNFGLWLSGLLSIASSVVGIVVEPWGETGDPGLATFLGTAQIAIFTAIWVLKDQSADASAKDDALEGTTNVLSTLQAVPQFLKYFKDSEIAPIAFGVLAAVDAFSYTAVAAFNIGRTADDIRAKSAA